MKVAHFIGSHENDTLSVRLGWALTRLVQKGKYSHVTHSEAILTEHDDGTVTIGSSSIRDGGVRVKRCKLNLDNWIIMDVPKWDVVTARAWFAAHDGDKYDIRGALASAVPFQWSQKNRKFCNQAVAASVGVSSPEIFNPAQFAILCETMAA